MKVSRDYVSKLDSAEKYDSNFGNVCTKKGGSFQEEIFSFLLQSSMVAWAPTGGGGVTCSAWILREKCATTILVAKMRNKI